MANVRDGYSVLESHEIEVIKINQGIINRMAENSQKLKGLLFIVVAGMLLLLRVLEVTQSVGLYAGYAIVVASLWYMDAKYLQLEQMFRKHHGAIVSGSIDYLTQWRFNPMQYKGEVKSVPALMFGWSFSTMIYPIMIFVPAVVWLVDVVAGLLGLGY